MTTYTASELIEKFMERDKNAIQEMNNYLHGPVTESRRLAFLEGRVLDLCGVVVGLAKIIEAQDAKETV